MSEEISSFNIEFTPLLYVSIKYNQSLRPDVSLLSKEDIKEYEKFKQLFSLFLEKLKKHDQSAFTFLSSIMSMWGYTRKYCGMCGKPIIGKYEHIQNRIVCDDCHNSYKITEELYKRDQSGSQKNKIVPKSDNK